jgi:alpha,alpha-trehalase
MDDRRLRNLAAAAVLALLASADATLPSPAPPDDALPSPERLKAVRAYIKKAWSTLARSNRDLPRAALDPKMKRAEGQPSPVYVSPREDRERVASELKALLGPADFARIELRPLPPDPDTITDHGLLYLPRPYVVPGGRFNEMYGWDSFFIQVGLLRDGELERARDMTANFIYEIDKYGTILNANRTYYLTRSQPPFLTEMVLGVYRQDRDKEFLRQAWPAIQAYYRFWTTPPHLVESIGLSRYYDLGRGPAPEVLSDERDARGRTHYDRVREYYRTHAVDDYDVSQYYDRATDQLTPLFYRGDRSMRESGYDPSNRFGPFSVDIIHYAPVCLNSLLYRMEKESAEIARELGRDGEAGTWSERAEKRREAIDHYLWDDQAGLYFDYDFQRRRQRRYQFATTFYPLWVGAASADQARKVAGNLFRFEAPGGILTSTQVTGNQWDAPFGWAPVQLIAIQGLRRYGFNEDADRLTRKFIGMVTKDFEEHGVIVEKYDVKRRHSDVAAGIRFGYSANQVGFGWTNAAFVELLADLGRSPDRRAR